MTGCTGSTLSAAAVEYLLIETRRCAEQADPRVPNLAGAVSLPERSVCAATVLDVVRQLDAWLDGKEQLKQTFGKWLAAVVCRRSKGALTLSDVRDLKEMAMELGSSLDVWRQRDREEALREGEQRSLAPKQTGRLSNRPVPFHCPPLR